MKNKSKAESILATIGVQPAEVSRIVNLAKGRLSRADLSVKGENRVLDNNKKRESDLSVIAQSAGLGNITVSSLNKNLAQFKKEVNRFREKNNIRYQVSAEEDARYLEFLYTLYNNGKSVTLLKLYAEEALSNNEKEVFSRAYELKDIEKVADFDNGVLHSTVGLTGSQSTTEVSLSDLYSLVKRFDKDFHAGKPVNPILLNDDGTPKVFYQSMSSTILKSI